MSGLNSLPQTLAIPPPLLLQLELEVIYCTLKRRFCMNTKKSLLLLVLFPTLFAVSLQGMVDPEALFAAAHEGNVETINALIVKGADVNAQDETDGRTALMGAARKGYVDAI